MEVVFCRKIRFHEHVRFTDQMIVLARQMHTINTKGLNLSKSV